MIARASGIPALNFTPISFLARFLIPHFHRAGKLRWPARVSWFINVAPGRCAEPSGKGNFF
jgi:hypothetical protein